MSEHTPGPWTTAGDIYADCGVLGSCRVVYVEQGRDVAYCPPAEGDNGNANARLMAASPELLSHLKGLLATITELYNYNHIIFRDLCEDIIDARAVIKAAEEEQP